ncbi:MAG: SusC/RagA family TonB-linked outer membrane protein [Prevotella sp.]|nr:SusC/RagA family TonB-linked outer membrane protein [Prevotella sp.]
MKKETPLMALICFLLLFMLHATEASAQGNKVTLKCNDMALPTALQRVEQESGYYKINYNYGDLSQHKVTANIKDAEALDAVRQLLKGLPYGATAKGKFIQINRESGQQGGWSPSGNTVTGRLLDADGGPMVGATVKVVGSQNATVTDVNGNYQLSGVRQGDVLEYSYIGMKTYRRKASLKPVNIILEADANTLGDVVVTGMHQMDKRLFTGSTTFIDAEEAKLDGVPDISRSLEGRAAGVTVQNVTGTFGTAPRIQVRGATSIYGNSQPLWIVDGVIQENVIEVNTDDLSSGNAETLLSSAIAGLNADDIESFQILRDGSATSIYGARAMAGVIVINTKKGKAGKTNVNYTGEFTMRLVPNYQNFNIMNSQEQMSVYQELAKKGYMSPADVVNANSSGVYGKLATLIATGQVLNTDAARNEWLREQEYRNTDWFDLLFDNSIMQNHSVSVSTGTEKAQHYASVSVMYDPGWYKQSKVKRYTANLSSTFNFSQKLKLQLNANASTREQKAPGTLSSEVNLVSGEVSRAFDINPYSYALNTSRVLDPDEYYTRNYNPFNIFHELEENYIDLNSNEFKIQGMLSYKPIQGLELNVLGAVKRVASTSEHHATEYSNQANAYRAMPNTLVRNSNPYLWTDPDDPYAVPVSILPYGGIYDNTQYHMTSTDFRATAAYNKVWNDTHIMNVFGGMETTSTSRDNSWERIWGRQYGFASVVNADPKAYEKVIRENADIATFGHTLDRTAAFFGTATYSYKGRYIVNGTIRYEGTNTLGRARKSRWLPTWNVSAAWNAHEEAWFEQFKPTLSHFTLKGSYSLTADRGPYSISNSNPIMNSYTTWRPSIDSRETGIAITELGNSDLTYEKKHELSLTADMGFLNNRINLEVSWYKRNNYDLIGPLVTEGVGGQIDKFGNIADMKSDGFELSLTTKNIKTTDFEWNTTFLYSHQHNKVTNLKSTTRVIDLIRSNGFALEGYPVRALFSIPFEKLTSEGLPTFRVQNDEVTMDNINFQEFADLSWLKYEGSTDPTDYGSLENVFKYKGFRLTAFIVYSFGNKVRLDPVFKNVYNDLVATPREFNNRWSSSGEEEITTVPVIPSVRQNFLNPNLSVAYSAYNYCTERVAKGDFIRMKEISLDYTFPKEWLQPIGIQNINLKLQATNLFLIYADKKLNGNDPEFFNTGGVASPMPRQFTFTVRLGF